MKILVVDDQQNILMMLKDFLEEQGYEVLTACDGAAALEVYREHHPSFTLTDISMPGLSGLDLLRQIKALHSEAIVMLMTGAGSENYAVDALRGGAANYFNKPVDINDLVNTLNQYATLAEGYDYEHYAADFLRSERLELEVPNDLGQANQAVQMIVNHARAIFPLADIFTLRFGLYEMIINAIEHGNLGINFEEKSRALEANQLCELIRERAKEPARLASRVRITCDIAREGMRCIIRDEGDGFDHTVYSNIADPAELFEQISTSLHGRGILLTRLQFDEMTFNERGNEVTIFKRATRGGDGQC